MTNKTEKNEEFKVGQLSDSTLRTPGVTLPTKETNESSWGMNEEMLSEDTDDIELYVGKRIQRKFRNTREDMGQRAY
jgi:hypothetical protein